MSWFRFLHAVPAIIAASVPLCWPAAALAQLVPPVPVSLTYTSTGGQVTALPRISNAEFRAAWGGTFEGVGSAFAAKNTFNAQVGSATAPMVASRALPLASVARGAALAIPKVLGVVGVVITLADIANAVRCKGAQQSVIYGGPLECDDGVSPETTNIVCWNWSPRSGYGATWPGGCFVDTQSAANSAAAAGTGYDVPYTTVGSCHTVVDWVTTTQFRLKGSTGSCDIGAWSNSFTRGGQSTMQGTGCAGGGQPQWDGKCPTGNYVPKTSEQVRDKIMPYPGFGSNPGQVARDAVEHGHDFTPDAGPAVIGGPASVNGPTTTTTTQGPSGTTTETKSPTYEITYNGDTYNFTTTTTTTNGTTTTTTNAPEVKTCGLPGTPACKIDETGTPTETGAPANNATRTELEALDGTKRTEVENSVQAPTFGFLGAPSVATCTAFEFPTARVGEADVQIPELNPCGVVETVRGIMAYIWAIVGAWWSLGLVRKTVAGGG